MPIVTMIRADLPFISRFGQPLLCGAVSRKKLSRAHCSKNPRAFAGKLPSQSGKARMTWSATAIFPRSERIGSGGGAANCVADSSHGNSSAPISMRETPCPALRAPSSAALHSALTKRSGEGSGWALMMQILVMSDTSANSIGKTGGGRLDGGQATSGKHQIRARQRAHSVQPTVRAPARGGCLLVQ